MNKMVQIKRAASPDYESDGYGWAMAQGASLRARRLEEIDWDNVAEEIETMGRSERSAYQSQVERVLLHMLKWEAQPERRGTSWWRSIMSGRRAAQRVLKRNPGLKSMLAEIHDEALEDARYEAAVETGLDEKVFEAISISIADAFDRPYQRPSND